MDCWFTWYSTHTMQTKVLNYRVIVEPDTYTGSKKRCYLAYVPTLDVADNGESIEEALEHIEEAIRCRIEALVARPSERGYCIKS